MKLTFFVLKEEHIFLKYKLTINPSKKYTAKNRDRVKLSENRTSFIRKKRTFCSYYQEI